jgi:hypothetical protein
MLVSALLRRLSPRSERGFSLVLAIVVLATSTVMVFGAIDAALYNTGTTRTDLDQKRALLAAYAGLSVYDQALNVNPDYWETCPVSGATGATGTTGTPVTVPGSTDNGSTDDYTYENLPATGQTGCNGANPIGSMIEKSNTAANGTFRVEITGTSQSISGTATQPLSRSIVAQFNAANFLQYIYFTNFELLDPAATGDASTLCHDYYWTPGAGASRNSACGGAISFITGDTINGPMHSNDDVAIAGSPTFGSTGSDAIETPGFYSNNGTATTTCTTCNILGTLNTSAPLLQPPQNDSQLQLVADANNSTRSNGCYATAGCVFAGPTTIVLTGSTFSVTNANYNGGVTATGLSPSNGVIYVANTSAGCTVGYTPYLTSSSTDYSNSYNGGCGNATVSGTYSSSLTIGTDNDIIINGNIEPSSIGAVTSGTPPAATGTALLGLVANDFVRIYHPLTDPRGSTAFNCDTVNQNSNNTNAAGSLSNLYVYAGILAIQHSFIVDNFDCGTPLGSLYVYGAIAQNYRGPVGTENGGTVVSGYVKGYYYDSRFQALSPPYFIDPVDAGWEVNRVTECDTNC